jgi:hypothetical protein
MWSGTVATIPTGWALCDGTGGTPDLRDKFIVGAKQDDSGVAKTNVTGSGSLTQSGGAATHTPAGTVAAHTGKTVTVPGGIGSSETVFANSGDKSHSFTGSSADYLPPYYALAFIQKL